MRAVILVVEETSEAGLPRNLPILDSYVTQWRTLRGLEAAFEGSLFSGSLDC